MPRVGAYEAKTHLPKLLERVARGEKITITKHGVPVAELVPAAPAPRRNVADAIAEIKELRREHTLGDLSLQELIEAGRR